MFQVQEPHVTEAADCTFRRRNDVESSASEQHDQVAVRLRAGDPGAAIGHGAASNEADGSREETPDPEHRPERRHRFRTEVIGVGASVVG